MQTDLTILKSVSPIMPFSMPSIFRLRIPLLTADASDIDLPADAVAYLPGRADCENRIKELKYDFPATCSGDRIEGYERPASSQARVIANLTASGTAELSLASARA